MTEQTEYREGDVVDYDTLTRPNRWCREGVAIAETRSGRLVSLEAEGKKPW